jgi:prolyl-tRNA synthetase
LGAKFKDAELLGIPMQIVVGLKNLDKGKIEIKLRKSGDSLLLSFPEEIENIPGILSNL